MSDPHKYNPAYSASDIQKYWKGELSAREMHELEAAALEDPFLADALEGMATYDTRQDMAELHERLAVRIGTPADQPAPANAKIRPLLSPWMRIAAVIILALGLGGTAYYILNTSTRKEPLAVSTQLHSPQLPAAPAGNTHPAAPATEQKAPATASQAMADSSKTTAAPRTAAAGSAIAKTTVRNQPKAALPARQHRQMIDSLTNATTAADDSKVAAAEDRATFGSSSASRQFITRAAPVVRGYSSFSQQDRLMSIKKDTVQYNAGLFKRADPLVFSGKVLDEHNNPLAGASIFVQGTSYTSTQTDKNGLFSLRFLAMPKDSMANRKLMVSYQGYEEASIDLSTLNSNQVIGNVIQLQPQGFALNEVLITGYGAKRKETLAEAPSASDVAIDSLGLRAIPVDGLLPYRRYLETAKKTLSVDSTIKGTEIISFEVSRKGELSAFKIEQSLSPAHDAGVIRIIKEGPSWRLVKGRTTRAAVRILF